MKKYKVSIITRTKNRNVLLQRAIQSVLGQTFQDWVMVIVNDGGDKEGVVQLVNQYENEFRERIMIIHNDVSLGMEAASNVGIKNSHSEYVVIHDDDDSWHPMYLEKCVVFLENSQFKSIVGVITHSVRIVEKIENDKIIIEYQEPFNTWLNSITIYRMAAGNVFPPISFLYNRRVLDEIGYYREDLPVLGDWEFNLRFIQKYDIYVIPEELAYYHHRLSITSGEYSNSVIGGHNKHLFYDTFLRNELLRKDFENNTMGIGYLVNIGKSFEVLHAQIGPIETVLSKIKNNKRIKRLLRFLR